LGAGVLHVVYEEVEDESADGAPARKYYYRTDGPQVILARVGRGPDAVREERALSPEDFDLTQSILSQRKDPDQYPELTYLGKVFSRIYLFRNPNFGHNSPLRGPQRADLPRGLLLEDGSNLGMVLNQLMSSPATKRVLLERLKQFYPDVEDVVTSVVAGTVETMFHERGLSGPIPSTRLSDGTLRYLCLLTILCHPEPPPLVCIEDPELGLHPDILCRVGELLIDASQRTQLIVTTHSDTLVSAFSEIPEAVVVCEKEKTGTSLRRLEPKRLKEWLEKYSLGELWSMGETGGNP
jgi:predicted ATPase